MALEVFKSFYHEEEALGILELLKEQGIECKLEKKRFILDKVIIGDGMEPPILLKMKSSDFTRAHQLIDEQVRENISSLDTNHYLYSFADEELFEIINKPDEWSEQDFVIAQKILGDRGYSLTEKDINVIKSKRIKELGSAEKEGSWWIILGYLFAIFFSIAGLFFGFFLMSGKKMLPDGSKVSIYDSSTRDHGRIIMAISIIMIGVALLGMRGIWIPRIVF